ncbi:GEVED domain-containing protein [Brumimicrobium oceani]|uniref:Fibronectin type-III domain-containing protein n=1 Tax=Brumimicrobium oceani TaxID=2100725 RepID=A0A2U2XBH4_9FLAO|nr:GEVED domain-containing protein [Brumimicrobium oceani]PWH85113.1 hypothetical protein DIT68_10785 [Brumimicrobium oceani]
MKKTLLKGMLLFASLTFGINSNAQCPQTPNDPIANPSVFNFCSGVSSAMITAETTTGGPGSLATTNQNGGNGCGGGVMFDVTNNSAYDISITSLDVLLNTTVNPTASVYYKTGTYLGSETVAANWTLSGTYPVTGAGGTFENIDVIDFVIPPGVTFGIFINYYGSYTTISAPDVVTNGDITITSGAGLCSPFGGLNANRGYNGTVNYTSAIPTAAIWYDAPTGGNVLGTTNPFETVGTSVMPTATFGTYDFYVSSGVPGCESVNRTLVTVSIDPVSVVLDGIDVSCNNGSDGSFALTTTNCGSSPFTYSVDGGAFGPIPTNLAVGTYDVVAKDANGDDSPSYVIVVGNADAPSNLGVANITSTSADLSWTANGSETSWDIEFGAPGFAPGTGNSLGAANTSNNPYTATLTPNTNYEYYVRADCGGSTQGTWSGPYVFSNAYCLPVYTSTSEYLSLIETVGAIADVSHTATSFPSPNGYTDETAQTMQVYETMTFDLSTAYSPTNYSYVTRMWVDWNGDFVFDHATELVSSASGGPGSYTQQVTIPAGTPVGTYRVRVRGEYGSSSNPLPCSSETWGSAADFMMEVITPPTCLPVMDIDTVNVSTTSIELDWVELNTATSWIIEYGPAGFTPGTGTFDTVTTNPYTITGLSPSSQYDFYIQADCGGGDYAAWRGPFSMYTDCGIAVAPFYEGFNNATQPQCWENISSNTSTSTNNFWNFNDQGDYGAANNGRNAGEFTKVDGNSPYGDSVMLITPQIDISQLTIPYLSFEWFSNNTNNPGDNVPLIVELFDGTSWNLLDTLMGDSPEWEFVNYDLSAYSNNIIQVRFMVNKSVANTAFYNDILLDEVRIDDCSDLGGIDGSFDVCRLDSMVNLDDNIIVKPNGTGEWSFPDQPNFLDDSTFYVSLLPAGSYDVFYVERAVCYDTTFATINVFRPSSAGFDGADTLCMNAPIDLFGALSGNVDNGGQWFDFSNTALPNSQPKAQAIPGNYNYFYVADNGVCPADTSIVTITVDGTCDELSIGQELFTDISVYPNPTTSQLNIVNPSNASDLKIEMLDVNGRVVLVENKELNNASEASLTITHLEKGVYTLRVYNGEGQRTFKVVKQ